MYYVHYVFLKDNFIQSSAISWHNLFYFSVGVDTSVDSGAKLVAGYLGAQNAPAPAPPKLRLPTNLWLLQLISVQFWCEIDCWLLQDFS